MSYFAAFVGLSASGKTTAIEACRLNLTNQGMRVAAFHERKSDPECILVDGFVATNQNRLSPESRMNLFIAIRQIAVRNVIKPSLAANDVTLLDRFWPCTVAYQAYGEGLDVDEVTSAAINGVGGTLPQRTFLFDIDPHEAASRLTKRGEPARHLEAEGYDFMNRVRNGYLSVASDREDFTIINAALPREVIARQVTAMVLLDLQSA